MKKSTYWLGIAIVGTVLGLSIQFASAWTPPSSSAPNGQVSAPVLTKGLGEQIIDGDVKIKGKLTVDNIVVDKRDSSTGFITLGKKPDDVARDTWPGGGADDTSGSVTFNTAGTYTICIYPKPSGQVCSKLLSAIFNQIDIEIWGGGGGGGNGSLGANNQSASFGFSVGGGGGSGAYSRTKIAVAPGDVLTVSVGYGGLGAGIGTNPLGMGVARTGQAGAPSSVIHTVRLGGSSTKVAVGGGAGGFSFDRQQNQDYFWCGSAFNAGGGTVITAGSVTNTNGNGGAFCEGGYAGGWSASNIVNLFDKTKAGGAAVSGVGGAFGKGGTGVYELSEVPALTCSKVTYYDVCDQYDEFGGCITSHQVANPPTYVYLTSAGFPSQYTATFNDPTTTGCTYTNQAALRFTDPAGKGQDGGAVISW